MGKKTADNPELRASIGEALASARGWGRLTQTQLAKRARFSRSSISMWENGETDQPVAALLAYSAITGVPVDRILEKCTPWDLNPEPADLPILHVSGVHLFSLALAA